MRLGHARGLACAKTKKFPCIFLASPPPTPPPRSGKRNGKEIFWFCFATRKLHKGQQSYRNEAHLLHFLVATEARAIATFSGSSNIREHTQPPSHSPLAFARAGCFGVVRVRLVASRKSCGGSKEYGLC